MKKKYEKAEMEITYLQKSDIIVTSGNTNDNDGNYNSDGDNYTTFG